jgi:hypothetical protein
MEDFMMRLMNLSRMVFLGTMGLASLASAQEATKIKNEAGMICPARGEKNYTFEIHPQAQTISLMIADQTSAAVYPFSTVVLQGVDCKINRQSRPGDPEYDCTRTRRGFTGVVNSKPYEISLIGSTSQAQITVREVVDAAKVQALSLDNRDDATYLTLRGEEVDRGYDVASTPVFVNLACYPIAKLPSVSEPLSSNNPSNNGDKNHKAVDGGYEVPAGREDRKKSVYVETRSQNEINAENRAAAREGKADR